MYKSNYIEQNEYLFQMKSLENENQEYLSSLFNSIEFKKKFFLNAVKEHQFMYLAKRILNHISNTSVIEPVVKCEENYVSDKKIAIYTCITGGYDTPKPPITIPNNCDFYMITDQTDPNMKYWKIIDIDEYVPDKSMTAKDKNRYIKMHPEVVFSDYDYSIYIDGNIQPVADFTKYINAIGNIGVATFMHPNNDCVYRECEVVVMTKKATKKEIVEHKKYLRDNNMPEHYGLADCGLIARKHNDEKCIRLMNEWWSQYMNHSKRDQISFAFSAYKLGIPMKDITLLGNNMYKDYCVRRLPHFL